MNDYSGQNRDNRGEEMRRNTLPPERRAPGGEPGGMYQHRNWQQRPERPQEELSYERRAGGPSGGGPERKQPDGPSRHKAAYQAQGGKKKKRAVLPVLLSILITFVLTMGMTWGLAAYGVLPGTAAARERDEAAGEETGPFGLSIHTDDPETRLAAEKLGRVLNMLNDNYYRVLGGPELLEAMTKGVVDSMESKYTYYLDPEEYQSFTDSMSGNYSGIGATVRRHDDGRYELVSIVKDGPAERAGLMAGDFILAVNGKDSSEYQTAGQLAADVKGEDGSTVTLTVSRDGEAKDVAVVRGNVVVEHVETRMLDPLTGYLYVSDFSDNLPEQFEAGLMHLKEEGAQRIVFDMRGNPGGSADSLIKCVDMLLPEGVIATIRGRRDGEVMKSVWKSEDGTLVPENMPFAILVDGGTASAAELFSGCLRDYERAVLIGEKTYGKGSGMNTWPLSDGSAVTITTFNYFLPKGDLIEGKGLEPHIEAEAPPAEYRGIPQYELTPEQDPGLRAALDYFSELGVTSAKAR